MDKKWMATILVSVLAVPAGAQITVVRSVEIDGFGGFGGSKKQVITQIAGDKHREEMKSEGKPSVWEKMAGAGQPIITRLDKKLRWTLNDPKKRYTETPLTIPLEKTSEHGSQSDSGEGAEQKPTTRITHAEFKVVALGQKKKIGAYECEGYEMKGRLETEDLETGKRTDMRMVTWLWTTPETGTIAQLKKEELDYARAYAKAMGLTESGQAHLKTVGGAMLAAMAGSGEKQLSTALASLPTELKKIKGYPIGTRVEWFSKSDEDVAEASPSAAEENMDMPTDVSSALGGLAAGFAKKKMEAKRPAVTENGRLMLGITTEIKSISPAAIPGTTFEVPAGYRKVS